MRKFEKLLNLHYRSLISMSDLCAHLKTGYALWYWLTLTMATMAVTLFLGIPEDLISFRYFRIAFGVIFTLWLPGYALVKAILPPGDSSGIPTERIDKIERIALSIGMSLTIVPSIGLLLYYTPWSNRLAPLVLALYVFILLFGTVGLIRDAESKRESANKVKNSYHNNLPGPAAPTPVLKWNSE